MKKAYAGETSRPLEIQKKGYKNNIKNRDITRSQIADRVCSNSGDLMMNWNNTKILMTEPDNYKKKIKESTYILLDEVDNLANCSVGIDRIWIDSLKEEMPSGNFKIK